MFAQGEASSPTTYIWQPRCFFCLSPIMCNNMGGEGRTQEILIVNETPMSPKIRNPKTHELNKKTPDNLLPSFSVFSSPVTDSA